MVVPDGHDENDTIGKGLVNGGESTDGSEVVLVVEDGLLGSAELVGDRVVGSHSGDVGLGVLDDYTILDVDTADFLERTSIGSVSSDELGDDGDLLGGIDSLAGSVEVLLTLAVRVEVASILVADTTISVITVTAVVSEAAVWSILAARVRGVGGGDGVGLPDIHLIAACAVLALSGVGVAGVGAPANGVGLSGDELDVVGALSIAITGSVLGTSLVVGLGGHATIGLHVGEVEGTVKTARKVGDIDVKGELLVLDLEHLIFGVVRGHEVDTRTNVGAGALGDKLHGKSVSRGGDTICATVVGTLNGAVLGAGDGVRAEGGIPSVTGVAVGITGGGVEPTPIGIEYDGTGLSSARATGRALLPTHAGMNFSSVSADLLAIGDRQEREREESSCVEHC
jgi:hypothetical protein